MRKLLILCVILVNFTSCSSLKERSKKRDLQSNIIRALNAKTSLLAKCAKKHKIYDQFGAERVRVELQLKINYQGQLESFQLDNKPYSEKFVDCMFNIVDLVVFPALKKGEAIALTQPIIFTKK